MMHARKAFTTPPRGENFTVNWDSPQSQGLVAWWPVPLSGLGNTTLIREMIWGQHGTLFGVNALVEDTMAPERQGGVGQVITHVGPSGDGGIQCPGNGPLDVTGQALTYSVWAMSKSASGVPGAYTTLLSHGDYYAGSRGYHLYTGGNSKINAYCGLDTGLAITPDPAAAPWTDYIWHLFHVTYNGATLALYMDGQPYTSVNKAGNILSGSADGCWLGIDNIDTNGHHPFIGNLRDWRVHNVVLPAWVMAQEYDPVGRWELYGVWQHNVYSVPTLAFRAAWAQRTNRLLAGGVN